MRTKNSKLLVVIIMSIVFILFYFNYTSNEASAKLSFAGFYSNSVNEVNEVEVHNDMIKRFYYKRKSWKTSNLGTIMFKNVNHEEYRRNSSKNKTFVVLFWQHWNWQKNRHLYNYVSKKKYGSTQALDDCSVKNCIFSGDNKYLSSADAVIIHMQKKQLPSVVQRNREQRWIFLSDESPINTFSLAKGSNLTWSDMSYVFNWTMNYRSDSDIPVPYGRTIPLMNPINIDMSDSRAVLTNLVPYWKNKKLETRTMVITSNCMQTRMKFIHGLQNYVDVAIIGGCSEKPENKKKCPGHFKTDCFLPTNYLFYLVLENSKCHQYITEKIFQHAYSKGAIPVIMGPSLKDCNDLLPPNSFLHVDNYNNIQELAEHMTEISKNLEKILHFHAWRLHFAVLNEHGYFKTKSYHLCRVCEALNYNDVAMKTYDENDLKLFFNKELLCDLKYNI